MTLDKYKAVQEPLPPGMGYWMVRMGALQCDCRAVTPNEARREALRQWPEELVRWVKSREISVRLISGFPEIPGHELIFGETVLPGDLLPEATSPAYRVIFDADDLNFYLLDVPSHAVFIPPFRAHATQRGQWKSPTLDECRSRASDAIGAMIDFDRSKGYSCE